ncbi:MAG: pyridoxamine 5'-phosphate oxidase family protein [Erysipelotrichaceae bacterium]|nr:pyridoxamine 5'-phosphate oxidase family protein [Erysipelotrichaceae bacterium]
MRRSDREVRDPERIAEILEAADVIRIGYYDSAKKEVYIVPVNYGYEYENGNLTFYFHGAKAGRKAELSLSDPSVGFEIDREIAFVEDEIACKNSVKYQSIIGNGMVSLMEEKEEKIRALRVLMKHITGKEMWDFDERRVQAVAVYKLSAAQYSCKEKE